MVFWTIFAPIFALIFTWQIFLPFLLRQDALPLLGVYSQAGKWYWLKFRLMKFVIERRQKKQSGERNSKKSENLMKSQFGGDGGERKIEEMEKKHELNTEFGADAVFFDAANRDGWYFTLGTAQRPENVINLFFILKIPSLGTFVNEELLTDTNVKSLNTSDATWRTASGFTVKCLEPMKKWSLSFQGNLVKSPGFRVFEKIGAEAEAENFPRIPASFELIWTNFGGQFDFDTACSPTSIAHSLAIEPWSRELFERLRASHQTHYEQPKPTHIRSQNAPNSISSSGFLTGSITLDSQTFSPSKMTSMRDHTIASYRRWSDIRRYIMMIYHLEDGTCVHTSVISMPETVFSQLEFGYIVRPSGQVLPVDRVHFSLPNHGESKHDFPAKFHYSFEVADGSKYGVDVAIRDTVSFKMGLDLSCQVNENMAEFLVDEKTKGWGFAEVEYRIQPY
ncbi:unnamed protein product [Caenorhabditis angaria]|uniref:Uncharacterized protein n=1 Tax=Caenorhabditis angaria TaxID=860376 RepID=A0A9P1IH36_9PELO|nr:unnamed protein product [Caenorhabditis angaria]